LAPGDVCAEKEAEPVGIDSTFNVCIRRKREDIPAMEKSAIQ